MDKNTRSVSGNNSILSVCSCFRGTCGVCAPHITRGKTTTSRDIQNKTKEGETKDE